MSAGSGPLLLGPFALLVFALVAPAGADATTSDLGHQPVIDAPEAHLSEFRQSEKPGTAQLRPQTWERVVA